MLLFFPARFVPGAGEGAGRGQVAGHHREGPPQTVPLP